MRNAPTTLMKNMGIGKNYRYAHDEPNAYAAGENYFPEPLKGTRLYFPNERGDGDQNQTKIRLVGTVG